MQPITGARKAASFALKTIVIISAAAGTFMSAAAGAEIKKKSVIWVTVPPLLYAVYAGIGYANGWEFAKGQTYPYFFLNWGSPAGAFGFTDGLPYMGCAWWILAILLFLIAVALGYLAAAGRIGRKGRGRA